MNHKVKKVRERKDKLKVIITKDTSSTSVKIDKITELEERVSRLEKFVKKLIEQR